MDGKGCWRDNVLVERFWKTIKYKEIYLHAYNTLAMHAPTSESISSCTVSGDRIPNTAATHRMRCTLAIWK